MPAIRPKYTCAAAMCGAAALLVGTLVPLAANAQSNTLLGGLFGGGWFGGGQQPQTYRSSYAPEPRERRFSLETPDELPFPRARSARRSAPDSGGLSITVTPRKQAVSGGGAGGYCVRLCDGRYFPVARAVSSKLGQAEACNAMCPGSKTEAYRGADISYAVDKAGKRYADLKTAYLFRERLVQDCSCGAGQLGVASLKVENDPTLREGDLVATSTGLSAFKGGGGLPHKASDFTPVQNNSRLASDVKSRLASSGDTKAN